MSPTPPDEAAVGGSGDDGLNGVVDDGCHALAGPNVPDLAGRKGKARWPRQANRGGELLATASIGDGGRATSRSPPSRSRRHSCNARANWKRHWLSRYADW